MPKKIRISFIFIFMTSVAFAETIQTIPLESNTPISGYKPLFAIIGSDFMKMQLSFKYDFFYPWKVGLYFAYSQYMFWETFENSSPFGNVEYNPELFYRFESKNNSMDDIDLIYLDYFQIGIEHRSNGEVGTNSRGLDRFYLQIQKSFGDILNYGANIKNFYILPNRCEENPDILDYIGAFEFRVFVKIKDKENKRVDYEELYAAFGYGGGMYGFDFYKGWQEYGIILRTFSIRVRPYISVWNGYTESLLDYNVNHEWRLRAGFIFE